MNSKLSLRLVIKNIFCLLICNLFWLSPQFVFADENSAVQNWGTNLGASWEYGQLGNSGMNLQDRSMSAISLEALSGYRALSSPWLLGLDLDYRMQTQITGLGDAGGTNLKGNAWLVGLGAEYQFTEKWAFQAAIDFLGRYDFSKQTAASEDDHLNSPLSLRLKGQYFFKERWTADLSANYLRWANFHIAGNDHAQISSQWMVGGGITYHFGALGTSDSATSTPSPVSQPFKTGNLNSIAMNKTAEDHAKNRQAEIVIQDGDHQ